MLEFESGLHIYCLFTYRIVDNGELQSLRVPFPGVSTQCMFVFGCLLGGRHRRQPGEAQTGYSTVQYRHDPEGKGVLLWLFISH